MTSKVRSEENAIMLWNRSSARTAYISGEELQALDEWANGGLNGFAQRLKSLGIVDECDKPAIREAIAKARTAKAPPRSFCAPESLHVELTARCELNCPQCYKERSSAQLPPETLMDAIGQADRAGVFQIALGGVEPMSYPHLLEAVGEINRREMASSVTTSGYGLDKAALDCLKSAGLDHVQVSLNGSNARIHSLSRDGFEYGEAALSLLSGSDISFGVNWVARADNIEDFPELLSMAKRYAANNINILRYKPSQNEEFSDTSPSPDQLLRLADTIKSAGKSKTGMHLNLKLDSAFSNLLCHLNGRPGTFSGCGAGRRFLALDADGHYRPCSHVEMKMKVESDNPDSFIDVWNHSEHLAMFRELEKNAGEPCRSCGSLTGCGGCRAVQLGLGHDFHAGDADCPFVRHQ